MLSSGHGQSGPLKGSRLPAVSLPQVPDTFRHQLVTARRNIRDEELSLRIRCTPIRFGIVCWSRRRRAQGQGALFQRLARDIEETTLNDGQVLGRILGDGVRRPLLSNRDSSEQ